MKAVTSPPAHVEGLGSIVMLPRLAWSDPYPEPTSPTGMLVRDLLNTPPPVGTVLAEVEWCTHCGGQPGYSVGGVPCPRCGGATVLPPRRWWRVDEVLVIHRPSPEQPVVRQPSIEIGAFGLVWRRNMPFVLPDSPEPGGVVLVVAEATCPWCEGQGWGVEVYRELDDTWENDPCRCTRPSTVAGPGPIVEMSWTI